MMNLSCVEINLYFRVLKAPLRKKFSELGTPTLEDLSIQKFFLMACKSLGLRSNFLWEIDTFQMKNQKYFIKT